MIIDKIRPSDTDGGSTVECQVTLETRGEGSQDILARTEPPHTLEADPMVFSSAHSFRHGRPASHGFISMVQFAHCSRPT